VSFSLGSKEFIRTLLAAKGAQFTCFTGTQVQILTQKLLAGKVTPPKPDRLNKKHKY
jgi:hypothetical protein